MTEQTSICPPLPDSSRSWRKDAARIVEELFPFTPEDTWDLLLDLRGGLREGEDWNRTLDLFLASRERLEAEHYLPFYRLRRLLSESLRLEAGACRKACCLKQALLRGHRSLAAIHRAYSRELFEHDLAATECPPLRVVEVAETS